MSGSPLKKSKVSEKQSHDRSSRTPSPEAETSGKSGIVKSESSFQEKSSPDPSIQVSSSKSGYLRGEKLWAECQHFSRNARKNYGLTDNFVGNLPVKSIFQLHQKIYTSWVNLFNSEKLSEGSSADAALSPSESKCDHQPATSTAQTSSIIDMVCQELEKLRNSDHCEKQSEMALMIPQPSHDIISKSPSPECQIPSSSLKGAELAPEEVADPLDLLLRLIDFSHAELNKIEERERRTAEVSQFLQRPSTLPVIASTAEEPGPYEADLLQRFRVSLEIEAQKLANKLRAQEEEQKPATDSSSNAVLQSFQPKDSTIESYSSELYQPLNEDSKASDLSKGWIEVNTGKDNSADRTFELEAKTADKDSVSRAKGDMLFADPNRSRNHSVAADADDTLMDAPSLPFDSPSSEAEQLFLDSPCTEEETEL